MQKRAFDKGVQQKNIIIDLDSSGTVGQVKNYKLGEERTLDNMKILAVLAITSSTQNTPEGRTIAPNAVNACFLTLKDGRRNVVWEDMPLRWLDPNTNGLEGAIEIDSKIIDFHESSIKIVHAASHANEAVMFTILYVDQAETIRK